MDIDPKNDIGEIDDWINTLNKCEQLTEQQIRVLIDKVYEIWIN